MEKEKETLEEMLDWPFLHLQQDTSVIDAQLNDFNRQRLATTVTKNALLSAAC
jgi:hypothetical protein